MAFKRFFLLASLGFATAQTSTVSLFFYDTDPQSLVGSVVGESDGQTTYHIQCPKTADSNDCGFGTGVTVIEGPSTAHFEYSQSTFVGGEVDCKLSGTTKAVCTASVTGVGSTPTTTTATLQKSEITYLPVVVTGSASKGTSASATTAQSTGNDSTATSTGSSELGPNKSSSTLASGTSTGGLPQMTGKSGLSLGGLAVAVAAAVL